MTALTFLGAARTVTGSKYLLEHNGARVLVDCGLFQGLKELRLRNWQDFPVSPVSIDALVLTHAHIDHVGYLPRLVSQGFGGRVFCTPGTADLCRIVLPDSGRIQEEDARQAERHLYSKHHPPLPLYSEHDAERAPRHLHPVAYRRATEIARGVEVSFSPAGHLLGSAHVLVRLRGGPTVLFGGDLGRYGRPVLPDPSSAVGADLMLVESTYGDRDHAVDDDGEQLARVIRDTASRGGKLIVPAFAIGRVEELLYWTARLERERRIPVLPVYVDSPMTAEALRHYEQRHRRGHAARRPSPMAAEALRHYEARAAELDPELQGSAAPDPGRLRARKDVSAFATARFQVVASTQQSKELTASRRPGVVISSSGMATGGRVLHHLAAALPDRRNTVLFVGYRAAGTRGRSLVDGAPAVKIHGRQITVAAEVARIDSMSAHADRGEIVRWLRTLPEPPGRLFLVHGEPPPMDALKDLIARECGWRPETPELGDIVTC